MNLNELRAANVRRCEQAFHPLQDWTPTDWACAMAGEAGEACNAVKKLRRLADGTNTAKDPQTEPEAIAAIGAELADTIIYADLLAARLGIDLGRAIRAKFNVVSRRMNSDITLEPGGIDLVVEKADRVADALQAMGDFWAYGMSQPEGAEPTQEDHDRVTAISTAARRALDEYRALRGPATDEAR